MNQVRADVEQAQEILRYFVQHPQASDDLEGIARWRLLQAQIARSVEEVRQALDMLVQMEFLLQDIVPCCGKRYSLNPDRVAESREFATSKKGR
jgi:hypothetical protein